MLTHLKTHYSLFVKIKNYKKGGNYICQLLFTKDGATGIEIWNGADWEVVTRGGRNVLAHPSTPLIVWKIEWCQSVTIAVSVVYQKRKKEDSCGTIKTSPSCHVWLQSKILKFHSNVVLCYSLSPPPHSTVPSGSVSFTYTKISWDIYLFIYCPGWWWGRAGFHPEVQGK